MISFDQAVFQSPTFGSLNLQEAIDRVIQYMLSDSRFQYRVIIGSDSQKHQNGEQWADFVSAIVVHRVGAGGIYFWEREKVSGSLVLRDRIYEEAYRSLRLAQDLVKEFEKRNFLADLHLEVHVDIGEKGETRNIINEVVGMVRGTGFEVKIKPDSYAASKVADRHT